MSDHKPVTAEELASVDAQAGAAMASAERIDLNLEGFDDCTEVGDMARVQAVIELAPRLARDLTAARTEIQCIADMLDEAGIGHHEGDTVRSRLARMIADANTEARRTEQAEAERDALADRVLDLGRELEALRAAVRAHRAAHEAGEGETVALVRLYQLAEKA